MQREDLNKTLEEEGPPKLKKGTAVITSERYWTPKTNPLIFHFEPFRFVSTELRLKESHITHKNIDGKDIYLLDGFFAASEMEELRQFSGITTFSTEIYADHESKTKGETPDRAMDTKEKWTFFTNPPQAMNVIYKWLSSLADQLEADITTLPWEMYDQEICSPAFATNRVAYKSAESMKLGRHKDYDPEDGVSFGIPILYAQEAKLHPSQFINGSKGKPWLISLMLYSTSKEFNPEAGLGTIFCNAKGESQYIADSRNMRMVFFEGDIIHGIEASKSAPKPDSWRVSYVFKLIVNPKL